MAESLAAGTGLEDRTPTKPHVGRLPAGRSNPRHPASLCLNLDWPPHYPAFPNVDEARELVPVSRTPSKEVA